MQEKRIHIITGHYGSGKSEIAVNLALEYAKQGKEVIFADLDIVNPYFRSNEARKFLEDENITVITTKYANTNIDVPALTGELSHYLHHKNDATLVLDVGGDDVGAKVIGRYRNEIPIEETCLYFVVNCFRPETNTVEGVNLVLEEIKAASRMEINYIINNSHLMEYTTAQDIIGGREFAQTVSTQTGIPIAFHAVFQSNDPKKKINFEEPILYMKKYMGTFGR